MSDCPGQQKYQPFRKTFAFFSCAGWIWTWMMLHYKLRNSQRMSWLTFGRVWGGWKKKKSCKMYVILCIFHIYLIETSVSFTAICSFFYDFCNICHSPGWSLKMTKKEIGWDCCLKENCFHKHFFANKLLLTFSHSAPFIPRCCKTDGRGSFCSTEWFILKTIHLYAKRHLYHKLHAIQTLTLTQWNLWSLCTM